MFLLGKANWWTPRWLTRLPDLLEPVPAAELPDQAADGGVQAQVKMIWPPAARS
jgi:hypothetical protein